MGGTENPRWQYLKNEYLIRYTKDAFVDWYLIQEPQHSHSGMNVRGAVQCAHLSTLLNKKNLYLEFDDTNGIGTLSALLNQA